jgi:AcrR family transcriptional regulator
MMSVNYAEALNRSERRKQRTIELLRQAAIELLQEEGYHKLTVKAITDRADLGYGTFYLYFKEKDDIVWDIMLENAQVTAQIVDARLAKIPFPRREYLAYVAIFETTQLYRPLFTQIFGAHGSTTLLHRYKDYLVQLHERNLQDNRYTPQLDLPMNYLAQFLAGALLHLMIWCVTTPNNYTAAEMAAMFYHSIYRQAPPDPSPGEEF